LEHCRAGRQKSIKDHVTVLKGTTARRAGKQSAGPALAQSHLAATPVHRLTEPLLTSWFLMRHPDGLAPSTVKRGMSSLSQFLQYCYAQGWLEPSALTAIQTIAPSPPRDAWLHPEQVVAITAVVQADFDPYEQFAWELGLASGARAFEWVAFETRDLSPRMQRLRIRAGKGPGAGKPRDFVVDARFTASWREHVERYDLRPADPMLFHRHVRFVVGGARENAWQYETGRRSSEQALRRLLRRIADAARDRARRGAFDNALLPEFDLTPVVLRRTFACHQLILDKTGYGGMDVLVLQHAMGHTRLDTTRIYLADVHKYLGAMAPPTNPIHGARLILEWKQERGLA
jgi:site-specific recombinase XerD